MSGKRYYWLKLQDGFFNSKRIKKLRKLAGGDTYTIIYLKMQLLAMKQDGLIQWTGLEDDFASELALDLDEDAENVKVTMAYLLSCGLAETSDNISFYFPYAVENTGSETTAADRMRKMRARNTVTPLLQNSYGEKEKEIDTEKEKRNRSKFTPPTLDEVKEYVKSRGSSVDPERFYSYYQAGEWTDRKGEKVRNWKQKLITWERNNNGERVACKSAASTRTDKAEWNIHYD